MDEVADRAVLGTPRLDVAQLIVLLMHLSRALDRMEGADDALLELALRAVALRLNTFYAAAGAPYGDDEAALRRWLYEHWPRPPTA